MKKINFYKYNRIFGTIAGLFAFFVFSLTVEPTASYWDCAEYISTSAKLQIGHPPGAPLFQMLGAIFSILAFDVTQIAYAVNMMSVTSSALTIMFLFWSISLIAKEILKVKEIVKVSEAIKIFGSSFLGSITFTFTDSFWYNAVEAEVYAMATLILAILFWLGLKWVDDFGKARSDKWLILISFVVGLSFGVHFMGLLAIPAIVMSYYFKNQNKILEFISFKFLLLFLLALTLIFGILFIFILNLGYIFYFFFGLIFWPFVIMIYYYYSELESMLKPVLGFLVANIIGVGILMGIFKLILPSTLSLFGNFEVFFVNDLGLPFNSGTIFSALLLISIFYYGITYTSKKKLYWLNTTILCLTFVFVGFSSWLMLPIRSNANTVINENAPTDARLLLAYYNLEQYPDT